MTRLENDLERREKERGTEGNGGFEILRATHFLCVGQHTAEARAIYGDIAYPDLCRCSWVHCFE